MLSVQESRLINHRFNKVIMKNVGEVMMRLCTGTLLWELNNITQDN